MLFKVSKQSQHPERRRKCSPVIPIEMEFSRFLKKNENDAANESSKKERKMSEKGTQQKHTNLISIERN